MRYASGSGTPTLRFEYVVQDSDFTGGGTTPLTITAAAGASPITLTGWNMVRMDMTPKWPRRTRTSSMSELALALTFTVSDNNTAVDYEAFCSAADQLACRFRLGADPVDQALFGADAIGSGCWRRYVIHQRLQLPR